MRPVTVIIWPVSRNHISHLIEVTPVWKMSNMTIDPPALSKRVYTYLARSMQVWVRLADESKYSWAADRTKLTAASYSSFRMRPCPVPTPRPLPDLAPSDCCLCLSIMSPARRMLSWLPEHSKLSTKICSTEREALRQVGQQRTAHSSTDNAFLFCSLPAFSFNFICFLVCWQKKSTQSLDSHGQFLWNPSSRNVIYVQVSFVSLTGLHPKLLLLSWIQIHFACTVPDDREWVRGSGRQCRAVSWCHHAVCTTPFPSKLEICMENIITNTHINKNSPAHTPNLHVHAHPHSLTHHMHYLYSFQQMFSI